MLIINLNLFKNFIHKHKQNMNALFVLKLFHLKNCLYLIADTHSVFHVLNKYIKMNALCAVILLDHLLNKNYY